MDFREQQKKMFCDNISELERNIERLKKIAIQGDSNKNHVEEIACRAMKNTKMLSMLRDV